jgi:hypothetical protein
MNRRAWLRAGLGVAVAQAGASLVRADEGFRPLFNGRNLHGWVPINVPRETFTVRDSLIISTGKPTGMLRTDQPYENFIIELEWRHMRPGGNAGLFVWGDALPACGTPFSRAVEVQILDGHETENSTSHGDLFAIQGATMKPDRPHPAGWMRCLPSEKHAKPSPEWNHYRVTCRDGTIKLAVNGKEVSGGTECVPRKGFICLESEGSECHFRNIRIQELPSSNPPAAETAMLDVGFVPLYSGLDLRGWKMAPGHHGRWKANDYILECDGKGDAQHKGLRTIKEYGDCVLVVDWKLVGEPVSTEAPIVRIRHAIALQRQRAVREWNRFLITLEGDRLTMELNGQTIIDRTQVRGVPARGPIGLEHHGDPVQYANLFIKELS